MAVEPDNLAGILAVFRKVVSNGLQPSVALVLCQLGTKTVGHQNAVCEKSQAVARGISRPADAVELYKIGLMVTLARAVIAYVRALFVPRHKL